ncbi:MAG TPA: SDR family oxidoreductase, partial [Enhygromyxa sp.]|nr:SDR family oxidoreductase [Enhygromyxa sp.]
AADVADNDALADLVEQTVARFGAIHGLVNNAGAHFRGPFESREAAQFGLMVDVNLRAPIVLSRLVLPHLREQGGFIVNVASLAGKVPLDGAATYSATKFGLRAFSIAMAEELRGTNVSVSLVSPGPIDTGFIMDELDEVEDIVFSQTMCTADDVAQMVLECARDGRREREFPVGGGKLATLAYLVPGLRRTLKPRLERKGAAVKQRLRRERGSG